MKFLKFSVSIYSVLSGFFILSFNSLPAAANVPALKTSQISSDHAEVRLSGNALDQVHSLGSYEIDTYHALTQAVEKVQDPALRKKLGDHSKKFENSALELANFERQNGKVPPEFRKDFKGYLMNNYVSLRTVTEGDVGVLKALETSNNFAADAFKKAAVSNHQTPESMEKINASFRLHQDLADDLRREIQVRAH